MSSNRLRKVECRRCHRLIVWVRTSNDRPLPLDAEPDDNGNVGVRFVDGRLEVVVASKETPEPPGVRYMPHFATCPGGKRS